MIYQSRQWDRQHNFIVLDTSSLTVEIFIPDRERILTIQLPSDSYVEVPGGYGYYRLKDLDALGKSERNEKELVLKTISDVFGIPIEARLGALLLWDHYQVWYARRVYQKDPPFDLSQEPIFSYQQRKDGEKMEIVDPSSVDRILGQTLWEKQIVNENIAVGIFNASGLPGIAATMARKLEKIGGRIIDEANWEQVSSNTKCGIRFASSLRDTYTLKRIQQLFHCTEEGEPTTSRFGIMMIVSS